MHYPGYTTDVRLVRIPYFFKWANHCHGQVYVWQWSWVRAADLGFAGAKRLLFSKSFIT